MDDAPEGILLVDKPQGITSHDVVDRVRRIFRMKKVGHAGTLDPMATGLMIILVGKATKVSQYMMSMDKEYTATMKLGEETDSQDADGEVLVTKEVPDLTEEQVRAEMKTFLGDQYQTPPMFSAKKVNGQPLYKLARKGKTVAREPRVINISKFDLTNFDLPEVSFIVGCSKGAYIRTIAHDLGQKIGCGAHLNVLRRTGIGKFRIEKADTLEELKEASPTALRKKLIPVLQAVPSHAL
ncbi:tRNA pseudouridine(55) synthase TruB [Coraliomargarita akajimensis]|uniref:tRNA pseudouridine synthase B n=1 Tax=Coraliomargarita akajimensis (strain DSM 45221 / IAM 15411 / JCM 23193 / KCTC 12865 / 04OKA010-24) TaxID=583355 RepID=D5EK62_CORAD|nr:tRNA pseudouridine(55) synthase TruB [Coraliomargarita akajimensis]ADE54811.1 tRNA pseudouridine synthase B [Coraliomargarita akajimensis DSM 45221]